VSGRTRRAKNDNMTSDGNGCPFKSSRGYTTRDARRQYLLQKGIPACNQITKSLQADLDPTKPLYFWQLYSLVGEEPIFQIL
jgi:hypothetical protein